MRLKFEVCRRDWMFGVESCPCMGIYLGIGFGPVRVYLVRR
jgi:hypothetical protein